MNRVDILRMAREAGFREYLIPDSLSAELERFVALVASHERTETQRFMAGHALIREIDARHQATIAEREECARLCESFAKDECNSDFKAIFVECAAAIRSRGDE